MTSRVSPPPPGPRVARWWVRWVGASVGIAVAWLGACASTGVEGVMSPPPVAESDPSCRGGEISGFPDIWVMGLTSLVALTFGGVGFLVGQRMPARREEHLAEAEPVPPIRLEFPESVLRVVVTGPVEVTAATPLGVLIPSPGASRPPPVVRTDDRGQGAPVAPRQPLPGPPAEDPPKPAFDAQVLLALWSKLQQAHQPGTPDEVRDLLVAWPDARVEYLAESNGRVVSVAVENREYAVPTVGALASQVSMWFESTGSSDRRAAVKRLLAVAEKHGEAWMPGRVEVG